MAYCPSCGEEVQEDAAFCSECGKSLDEESEPSELQTPVDKSSSASNSEDEEGINWIQVAKAIGFALIPAFLAYLAISIASGGDPVGIVFVLGLPIFGYFLYQRPTTKAMAGGMLYHIAVELLLSPFVFMVYTFVFASQNTSTEMGQAGAAIGGFALIIAAFVIGYPTALALYFISGRLEQDQPGE